MYSLAHANMFAGCDIDDLNIELNIVHWPQQDLVRLGADDLSDV